MPPWVKRKKMSVNKKNNMVPTGTGSSFRDDESLCHSVAYYCLKLPVKIFIHMYKNNRVHVRMEEELLQKFASPNSHLEKLTK